MKGYIKISCLLLAAITICAGCGKLNNGAKQDSAKTVRVHGTVGVDCFTTTEGKNYGLYGVQASSVPISLPWEKDYKDEARKFFSDSLTGKEVKIVVKIEYKPGAPNAGITYDEALVYLPDGTLLNEKLLEEGYAHVNTNELQNDSGTLERFQKIEKAARAAKKGAWKYWADKMPANH